MDNNDMARKRLISLLCYKICMLYFTNKYIAKKVWM